MSDNVVRFNGITKLDMPAHMILQEAIDAGVKRVVIVGYTGENEEYFATSIADAGDVVWLLERCKHILLNAADNDQP